MSTPRDDAHPPDQEIPRPEPIRDQPLPEIPQHLQPGPSPVGVTTGTITGRLELAVGLKVTYALGGGGLPELHEEQRPLSLANEPHDELLPGVQPSTKAVPELVAYSTGTDLVIRAHARPPHPVGGMKVGVVAGSIRHYAKVTGTRYVDREGDRLVFTPPESFEAMPLRYELAYGGIDTDFQNLMVKGIQENATPEEIRRVSAVAKDFLNAVPPVAYPRNPHGKGFALVADADTMVGKELPNLELDQDRLSPDRLWPTKPTLWTEMPVPAGFDYMDVGIWPRSAMLGLPPMADGDLDQVAEVRMGQVPPGFSRGNAMYAERETIPSLIHPQVGRCAPIGLRLPFLRGDEPITLYGMDPAEPVKGIHLPGHRPTFRAPSPGGGTQELVPELYQVFIDVDEHVLCTVWVARTPWPKPLKPGEDQEMAAQVKVDGLPLHPSTP